MISILPVAGLPEIAPGDDLAAMIVEAAALESGDVVVVAHKVVSKAEQRVVRLADIEPSERARELAAGERDPRELEVILRETARVVRERAPLVIAETRHGFVCASAGVDHSNAPDAGAVVLLPLDLRGTTDRGGRELRSTQIALADEVAAAADLARTKAGGVPVVIVRGLEPAGDGTARELVIEPERDLFR